MSTSTQTMPRAEHPRPQFVRADWMNLNGEWQFEVDSGDSGFERGMVDAELKDRITVPFCPESELSGIGNKDFLNAVRYRRTVVVFAVWFGLLFVLFFLFVVFVF